MILSTFFKKVLIFFWFWYLLTFLFAFFQISNFPPKDIKSFRRDIKHFFKKKCWFVLIWLFAYLLSRLFPNLKKEIFYKILGKLSTKMYLLNFLTFCKIFLIITSSPISILTKLLDWKLNSNPFLCLDHFLVYKLTFFWFHLRFSLVFITHKIIYLIS